jgi:hypothetical protein
MPKETKKVQAILYSDSTTDSKRARDLLKQKGVRFDELTTPNDYRPEPGFTPPVLHTREGEFRGIERITGWITFIAQSLQRVNTRE